jgi:hypothetical protein
MLLGGVAWMTVMSTFNVCAQVEPPAWVRARALSYYLLVFQGALAVGSGAWGALADRSGCGLRCSRPRPRWFADWRLRSACTW